MRTLHNNNNMANDLGLGNDFEEEVYNVTRKCQFDFNTVAVFMKDWCQQNNKTGIDDKITPLVCRKIYADYFSKLESIKNENIVIEDTQVKPLIKPTVTFDVSKYDNLSFDDMMTIIKQQENENMRLKENIFDRVLSSLKEGTSESDIRECNMMVETEVSLMQALVNEQKREKEISNEKALKAALEKKEREEMDIQREILRNRHTENNSNEVDVTLNLEEVEDDPELNNIITFDIESLLSNESLENILLDIEKELEMNACEKSDGHVQASELSGVLDYLDSVATNQRKNKRQPVQYDRINNLDSHHEMKSTENIESVPSHFNFINLPLKPNKRDIAIPTNVEPKKITTVHNNSDSSKNSNGSNKEHVIFQEFSSSTGSDDEIDDSELDNWRTERVNIKAIANQQSSVGVKKSDFTASVWKGGSITKQNDSIQADVRASSVLPHCATESSEIQVNAMIHNSNISTLSIDPVKVMLDQTNNIADQISGYEAGPGLKQVANAGAVKVSGSLFTSDTRGRKDGTPKFSNDVSNRRLVFSASNNENIV